MIITETQKSKSVILSDEEYFEQLDHLYKVHEFKVKREKLKKILKRIQKDNKKGKDATVRLEAIKRLIEENTRGIDTHLSELYEEFNLFELRKQVQKIEFHLNELKKAYSKNQIDGEVFKISHEYYIGNLEAPSACMDKMKILSHAYLGILHNKKVDLSIEFNKLKNLRKKNKIGYEELKSDVISKIKLLEKKTQFFKTII